MREPLDVSDVALVDEDVVASQHCSLDGIAGGRLALDEGDELTEIRHGASGRRSADRWVGVGGAKGTQSSRLLFGAREGRVGVGGIGQRSEATSGVGHVPHARAGRGEIEVDNVRELAVLEYGGVLGEIDQ
jgi:hypothetical protein